MTITWAAADLVGALLARRPGARGLLYLAVGTGDAGWDGAGLPKVDRSRRALVAEVARLRLTPGEHLTFDSDTFTVRATVSLPPGLATGPLREIGLFGGAASPRPGSGTLVSYRAHKRVDKAAGAWLAREVKLVLGNPLSEGGRLVVGSLLARWKDATGLTYAGLGTSGSEHTRRPLPAGAVRYVADAHAVDVTVTLAPGEGASTAIDEVAVFGGPATATVGTGWRVATESIPVADRKAARRFRHRLRLTLVTDTGVTVPAVTGSTLDAAKGDLLDAQLQVGVVGSSETEATPPGTVLAQVPKAGEEVDEGAPVDLTVAIAPLVEVPELLGLPLLDAAAALDERGLDAATPAPTRVDDEPPPGTVVEVDPPAGTRLPEGSVVTLVVSARSKVVVPDVRGYSLEQVRAALDAVDLTIVEPTGSTPSDVTTGHVVSHVPARGSSVDRASSVAVTLALAKTVAVPDLTGLDVDEARAALATAGAPLLPAGVTFPPGLQIGRQTSRPVSRGKPAGVILSHKPPAGSPLPKHGLVDVEVSAAVTARVPDLRGLVPALARAKLGAVGLRLLRAAARQADDAEPGTIVAQSPRAGAPIGVETGVTVWVAAGKRATVPRLAGLDLAAAREALETAGLSLGGVQRFSRAGTRPATVIDSKPEAGTVVPRHTPITLFVTAGLPNFVGMHIREAKDAAAALELHLQPHGETTEGPPDHVIAQEPPPGFDTGELEAVSVTVSEPALVDTPKLTGLFLDAAMDAAAEFGLEISIRDRPVDAKLAGTVVDQDPNAGSPVPVGTTIAIDLAQEEVDALEVPDVGSTPVGQATQKLVAAGLAVGDVTPHPSLDEPDEVIDQDPLPGTIVPASSEVDLTVATDQGVVEVPDVRGLTVDEATEVLAAAGLGLVVPGTDPVTTITTQVPEPEIIVPNTATVAVS